MLINVETNEPIDDIPPSRRQNFDIWRSRLTEQESQAIMTRLDDMIETGDIHTSSWMPGSDWTDTPFQVIYEKACRQNFDQAAMCFGLFVWLAFINRPERWASGRYEKDGAPIGGMTYFRVDS